MTRSLVVAHFLTGAAEVVDGRFRRISVKYMLIYILNIELNNDRRLVQPSFRFFTVTFYCYTDNKKMHLSASDFVLMPLLYKDHVVLDKHENKMYNRRGH